jgi:hypothetical protein
MIDAQMMHHFIDSPRPEPWHEHLFSCSVFSSLVDMDACHCAEVYDGFLPLVRLEPMKIVSLRADAH